MDQCLLNIDLGEFPGEPESLYGAAHLANIACGGHAGDEASIARALELCARNATLVGAHPSYPDRENFGRLKLTITPAAMRASVAEQCARLAIVATRMGTGVGYLKPHGALYHAADTDTDLARAVIDGARDGLGASVRIRVLGPAGGELARAALAAGLGFLREGFADRGRRADGSLVPRGQPGALITDPASARAQCEVLLHAGGIDTLCVHGDTPGAAMIAHAVREAIDTWNART